MPLLTVEAQKLSENDLVRGIIEEFIDSDNLYSLLNFTRTEGKAYVYNREKTLAGGDWLDPSDVVKESASTSEEITTKLRILIGDVDVDKFLDGTMSDAQSQKAIQIASKVKGMARQFKDALVNGDTVNKQFDGIRKLLPGAQTVTTSAGGDALTFTMLDELLDACEMGADAILMRKGTYRAYKALLRAMGGSTPEYVTLPSGITMPAHDGVPIVINDKIGIEQKSTNDTAHIYAVNFDEAQGLHGLFGGQGAAGFVVEDIGTVQNKDSTRTRVKMYCGLALKSTKAVAAIEGVRNV